MANAQWQSKQTRTEQSKAQQPRSGKREAANAAKRRDHCVPRTKYSLADPIVRSALTRVHSHLLERLRTPQREPGRANPEQREPNLVRPHRARVVQRGGAANRPETGTPPGSREGAVFSAGPHHLGSWLTVHILAVKSRGHGRRVAGM